MYICINIYIYIYNEDDNCHGARHERWDPQEVPHLFRVYCVGFSAQESVPEAAGTQAPRGTKRDPKKSAMDLSIHARAPTCHNRQGSFKVI